MRSPIHRNDYQRFSLNLRNRWPAPTAHQLLSRRPRQPGALRHVPLSRQEEALHKRGEQGECDC